MEFDQWARNHNVVRVNVYTFDKAVRTLLDFESKPDVAGIQYSKTLDYAIVPDMYTEDETGNYYFDVSLSPTSDVISNIQLFGSEVSRVSRAVLYTFSGLETALSDDLILLPVCSNFTLWKLRLFFRRNDKLTHVSIVHDVTLFKSPVRAQLAGTPVVRSHHHVYENGQVTCL